MTDQQPALFPADQLATECPVCGATKQPHDEKAEACTVDRDRAIGLPYRRRPRACLNSHDPTTTPFPEGF